MTYDEQQRRLFMLLHSLRDRIKRGKRALRHQLKLKAYGDAAETKGAVQAMEETLTELEKMLGKGKRL